MTARPFAVLGAGVMGLAVATELAARGHAVTLVDPAGGPGGHGCSWWAGGMLAPWCEYENAEEPVLRLGQAAIGWWDRHLAAAGAGGVGDAGGIGAGGIGDGSQRPDATSRAGGIDGAGRGLSVAGGFGAGASGSGVHSADGTTDARRIDGAGADIGLSSGGGFGSGVHSAGEPNRTAAPASSSRHAPVATPTGTPTAVTRNGTLVVALGRDRRELDRFGRRTHGFRTLDTDGIAALEPDLGPRFDRALFFENEAHLDPRAALAALQAGLAARGIAVQPAPPPNAQLIDCRGLSARDMLPDLRGVRGEMLVLRCPDVTLSRPVRLLHPRVPIYLVPRGDGVYMLGATMIESDRRGVVTARSVLELLSAAYALHPAFAEAEILQTGADARPAFPDNLPRIGRAADGRLYANGLYRHGYLLAPAAAIQLADHIETGTKPEFWHET